MILSVTIGVFSLFHPHAFEISPWGASRVTIHCLHRTIEGASAQLKLTSDCEATGANNAPTDFVLSVPGKIRRHYRGTLHVTRLPNGELAGAVKMDLETTVASIIAAESPADAAPAMLEAQAIVTRSYLAAGPRHKQFDFCDTTHCQFLKDPVAESTPHAQAARRTAGRVLTYYDRIFAAFYAARCEGLLAPLPSPGRGEYPYFAVACDYCRRNPLQVPAKAGARPHHHGMCQMGANDLARQGWSAMRILEHYFPGAVLR